MAQSLNNKNQVVSLKNHFQEHRITIKNLYYVLSSCIKNVYSKIMYATPDFSKNQFVLHNKSVDVLSLVRS